MTTILTFPMHCGGPADVAAERPSALLNALTIDVEDYFQVSGFDHCVDRARLGRLPSRVAASTDRILDVLAAANVRATFFVLGWVAERQPSLVRAIRAGRARDRLARLRPPAGLRADARGVPRRPAPQPGRSCRTASANGSRAYRAPSFSITTRSLWALDVLVEEGITLDSSIYPTHHDRYGIPGTPLEPHRIDAAGRRAVGVPAAGLPLAGYPLPVGGGGYFRLYPYALTRSACRASTPTGRPVRRLPAPVGARPRPAAHPRRSDARLPPLRQPAPHRGAAGAAAARLRVRHDQRGADELRTRAARQRPATAGGVT